MKRVWLYLFAIFALLGCNFHSNKFILKGKFDNLQQGEFYLYSLDGNREKIDTVTIKNGSFKYEMPLEQKTIFVMHFSNFSEQPVFAEPNITVKVKADARHLKNMEITGSNENELMNSFRKSILEKNEEKSIRMAENFIKKHPESMVSLYLLDRYLTHGKDPQYEKICRLVKLMTKAQPNNNRLKTLQKQLDEIVSCEVGKQLPYFHVQTVKKEWISDSLFKGKYLVINIWSSWNFDSQNVQRVLHDIHNDYGKRINLLSVSLDMSMKDYQEATKYDSVTWKSVCDEQGWDGVLVKTWAIKSLPDNIVVSPNGKILARGLKPDDLKDKIKKLLEK